MKAYVWLIVGALLLFVGGCSTAPNPPSSGAAANAPSTTASTPKATEGGGAVSATNSQNGMEVKVVFDSANLAKAGGDLVFKVSIDNHSVDLAKLDLARQAVLKPSPGEPITAGFRWTQEGSGHHASGVLTLPNRDGQGRPIVIAGTKSLTLELRDLGGVAVRAFRFQNQGWKVSG